MGPEALKTDRNTIKRCNSFALPCLGKRGSVTVVTYFPLSGVHIFSFTCFVEGFGVCARVSNSSRRGEEVQGVH